MGNMSFLRQSIHRSLSSAAQNTTILAGIYLHIPFCKQACTYCNFHFTTSLRYKNEIIDSMAREMELEKHYLGEATVHTIYFGGGTPSLLNAADLDRLFVELNRHFMIDKKAEITLEANPDDITIEKLKNITMDLIYGSPLLTDEMWKENVEKAINFDIPHLSCYALTVEEKTPLH